MMKRRRRRHWVVLEQRPKPRLPPAPTSAGHISHKGARLASSSGAGGESAGCCRCLPLPPMMMLAESDASSLRITAVGLAYDAHVMQRNGACFLAGC